MQEIGGVGIMRMFYLGEKHEWSEFKKKKVVS